MNGLEAVLGYAVGTLQVLFVDWWRRVAAHRRQLRLLQAELRRLRMFEAKFNWVDGLPPEDEKVPAPPRETNLFVKTIGETEWRLTDEHEDDNSQQAFLQLLDGFSVLQYYAAKVMEVADLARTATSLEKATLRARGKAYADAYDSRVDEVLFLIDDALIELERRLTLANFGDQLNRAFDTLPAGSNPKPLEPNDPRVDAWRKRSRVPRSKP